MKNVCLTSILSHQFLRQLQRVFRLRLMTVWSTFRELELVSHNRRLHHYILSTSCLNSEGWLVSKNQFSLDLVICCMKLCYQVGELLSDFLVSHISLIVFCVLLSYDWFASCAQKYLNVCKWIYYYSLWSKLASLIID